MNAHINGYKYFILALTFFFNPAWAGFDFCSGSGSQGGGSGHFQQEIVYRDIVEVGELPIGVSDVDIRLTSPVDVDIQLYDKETGDKLVHWPSGVLAGSSQQSMIYHGIEIVWSGYNGDGTGLGNEFIRVKNANDVETPLDRAFIMKVYGYRAGEATVNYTWAGGQGEGCQISESGNGTFQQEILLRDIVEVGEIPTGVDNLTIELNSIVDVDVQLYDTETGLAIIAWPNGLLNGSGGNGQVPETITYENMTIIWSGYNGDGTGPGNEYIVIEGTTTRNLTMKAYGYRAGFATVNYSWGEGNNPGEGGNGGETDEETAIKNEVLPMVNSARSVGRNCGNTYYPPAPAVTWNSKLYAAAKLHNQDMIDNNFFDHYGSNGSDPGDRISAQGYNWRTYGENIAGGQTSAQQAMDGWLNSPGHCVNIMNPNFKEMGLSKDLGGQYGIYWTQVFGTSF